MVPRAALGLEDTLQMSVIYQQEICLLQTLKIYFERSSKSAYLPR